MEMMEYLQDNILALCGIISENIKTITRRILYHLKLAPTHLLMAEILERGPATLNPLNWHCYRFALGHHLFNHKLSPHDKKEAKLIFPRHASVQAQASTASPSTHPLFMLPFTLLELATPIKKIFPDKSSAPSGITNRMLQAGDAEFQSLLLLLFNAIWESHVQPTDWQLSLTQPIYKGHDKDKTDPASYRQGRGRNLGQTF